MVTTGVLDEPLNDCLFSEMDDFPRGKMCALGLRLSLALELKETPQSWDVSRLSRASGGGVQQAFPRAQLLAAVAWDMSTCELAVRGSIRAHANPEAGSRRRALETQQHARLSISDPTHRKTGGPRWCWARGCSQALVWELAVLCLPSSS